MEYLIKETKQVHLSTTSSGGRVLNSDVNYKSQIEYNIPNLIRRDDSIEYIMFSVPYAVIPVSFYTINETNNTLVVLENGITTSYIFPFGNYNANQFITKFQSTLPNRFSITLDTISSKFIITNNTYSFSLLSNSTIDYIMGFSGTQTSTSIPPNNILAMPRVCNFLALPRISMRCNLLANSTMSGTGAQANDLVITIPNNSKPNGEIVYNNNSNIQMLFQGDILNTFVVSLTNDTGQLINFNGISSFFVFQFDIYRTKIDKPLPFYNILANVNNESNKKDLEQQI
jgi:hypothetical protein